MLGDSFHSTPRAIGAPTRLFAGDPSNAAFAASYAARDRVVYAGANDGLLHAFDAGSFQLGDDLSTPETEITHYDPGTGAELFGYVPGRLLDRIKLLPRNSPRTEYFVDGPIAVADAWLGDGSGSDTTRSADEWATVLITGFREGGAGYLALDITDPGAGSGDPHGPYPKLLWEFADAKLAESWSEPILVKVKLRNSAAPGDFCGPSDGDGDCREQWVAIFAGGYQADGDPNHPSYVADPTDPGWSDRSKAIFMVALDTGQVLASVEFDASGSTGPAEMLYALPSTPAVLDLNFDGFADVVYVGDLGGQIWKWDIHSVGEDSDSDGRVDNWSAGVFFRSDPQLLTNGSLHHRSFFFPPTASFLNGSLVLAFGSGERQDLEYPGDANVDDENRFFVVKDVFPTGSSAFPGTLDESSLTDVTGLDVDNQPLDSGYFFKLADGEKFVSEVQIFAGEVIATSYTPEVTADLCATLGGQAFLYVFSLASGQGYFEDPADPPSEDRRLTIGSGFPSSPKVIIAMDPEDDTIVVKTSEGPRVLSIDAPPRNEPRASLLYWKHVP